MGSDGPLWYRGYFPNGGAPAAASLQDIDRIREHFGVQTILVGHTTVPTITPLYQGKVIAVQVYPRRDDGGPHGIRVTVDPQQGIAARAPGRKDRGPHSCH